jgi:hypothetical protein
MGKLFVISLPRLVTSGCRRNGTPSFDVVPFPEGWIQPKAWTLSLDTEAVVPRETHMAVLWRTCPTRHAQLPFWDLGAS